jgi:hypothetical protein
LFCIFILPSNPQSVGAVVCGVNSFGVKLVLLSTYAGAGDSRVFDFAHTPSEFVFKTITDMADWKTFKLRAAGPCEIKTSFPDLETLPSGCGLVIDEKCERTTLLRAAAWQGFPRVNVKYLKLLWVLLKVPGAVSRVATREETLLMGLLRFVLPGLTPAEYEEILKKRAKNCVAPEVPNEHLTEENIILIQEGMDAADARDFAVNLKPCKISTGGGGGSDGSTTAGTDGSRPITIASAGSGASSAGAGSSTAGVRMPTLHEFASDIVVADVKPFLPNVVGCTISLETMWHHRWKAQYPRPSHLEQSIGRIFGGTSALNSRSALIIVLCQIWAWHEEATGESCPWDFF